MSNWHAIVLTIRRNSVSEKIFLLTIRMLVLCLCLSTMNLHASTHDGPYIFYENNQAIVQTINANGTVSTESFSSMNGRSINVYSPQLNRSFTVPIKSSMTDEVSIYSEQPAKLYAISDIEGEFEIFYTALLREGVINSDFKWSYGRGHLVVLGDVFSRGNYVNEILWLIYKLEAEALAVGGRVHYIMGNHEMFHIMRNDFRYTTQKYVNSAAKLNKQLHQLYNNQTELGRWLRTKNIITKLGDYILVHAGISQTVHDKKYSIQYMNEVGRARMRGLLDGPCTGDCAIITGSTAGLYWYRGIANGDVTQGQVDSFLNQLNAKRMIIGHTKGPDIRTMYQNKVILIDQSHQDNWAANYTRALQQNSGCFNKATGRRLEPLTISYERLISNCDVPPNSGNPSFEKTYANLAVARGAWQHFSIDVPEGLSNFSVQMAGGTGDADLYVRRGSQATTSSYDCRPYLNGNAESCTFSAPLAGTWHVSIRGYAASSGITLRLIGQQ
jgi:hypothetical protein